jgi:hypothetical protein
MTALVISDISRRCLLAPKATFVIAAARMVGWLRAPFGSMIWFARLAEKYCWMRMSGGTHISTLYREFADALTDVLAENAVGLASRGRLARTRAAVKKHPDYSEHGYFLAVEMAFKQWEAMQNVGSPQKTSDRSQNGA